jgi:hypothetical protein
MLAETEFESYGLKSSENVTPVVGSAISGLPPGTDPVVDDDWQALTATAKATAATSPIEGLRFIDLSPP